MAQATMVLTVMVENAVTEFGLFENGELAASWQTSTPEHLTADEARMQLRSGLAAFAPQWGGGDMGFSVAAPSVVLGSVVPALTDVWCEALAAETGGRVLVMGPRLKTGMAIACKNPAEVGADRVADALAARELAGAPCIVVHLEAATAITVVDAKGALAGGMIAPGFEASVGTLSHVAARLTEVEAGAPRQVVGKTTQEAIASGVFWGEVARIDGLVAMARAELAAEMAGGKGAGPVEPASGESAAEAPESIPVLITGKNAQQLAEHLACHPRVHPALTLQGLALCARG